MRGSRNPKLEKTAGFQPEEKDANKIEDQPLFVMDAQVFKEESISEDPLYPAL